MTQAEQYDAVVLGSGESGKYIAWHLAAAGKRTAVIERGHIGGSCPNVACLPSKNVIHSAKVASYFRRSAEFGIASPQWTIDMSAVRERKRRMVDGLREVHLANFKKSGAEIVRGEGRFIGEKTLEVVLDGQRARLLHGEMIFLNTGTRARIDPIPGLAEAKRTGVSYRLAKIPMAAVLRTRTLSETKGFLKVLISREDDRILGFCGFGTGAGEIMAPVQLAMKAGLPYTMLREMIFTHPTLAEGLIALFSNVPKT